MRERVCTSVSSRLKNRQVQILLNILLINRKRLQIVGSSSDDSAHQNHIGLYKLIHVISCTCYLWPWLGPPLTTMHCSILCTSGFLNDVIFTRNGPHGAWPIGRVPKVTHQGADPGRSRDVYDCLVNFWRLRSCRRRRRGLISVSCAHSGTEGLDVSEDMRQRI